MSQTGELSEQSVESVVAAVYAQATLEPPDSGRVVALGELIASYPIRVAEVRGLTYRRAAEFLTAEIGQPVRVPEGPDRRLAGFLYVYCHRGVLLGVILVNADDPIVRRRFSAAHELGHYVRHFLPLLARTSHGEEPATLILAEGLGWSEGSTDAGPTGKVELAGGDESNLGLADSGQLEREADEFAASLLMPAAACERSVERLRGHLGVSRNALIRRLAGELLVSQEALSRRLRELGLLDDRARSGARDSSA